MFRLDVPAILEFFTDARTLSDGLAKEGMQSVSYGTIQKWRERGVIPIRGLLALKTYAERRERAFSIDSFIVKGE